MDFPYTSHLRGTGDVIPTKLGTWKEKLVVELELSDIIALNHEYQRIADQTISADYVFFFAYGGIPLLDYVIQNECFLRFGSRAPKSEEEHDVLKAKFHLFPGLAWENIDGKAVLYSYLESLPKTEKVLFIDTSFTGNAINRLENVVSEAVENGKIIGCSTIEIDGICGSSDACAKLASIRKIQLTDLRVHPGFLHSLIFEDFSELLGFTHASIRDVSLPHYTPGAVVISHNMGGVNYCFPFMSVPLYTSLEPWLTDPFSKANSVQWLTSSEKAFRISEFAWLGLRRLADIQYDMARNDYHDGIINEITFVNRIKEIVTGYTRDVTVLNRKYKTSIGTRLSHLDYWIKKDKILKGKLKPELIELMFMDGFLVVTVNICFEFEGKRLHDLSLPLHVDYFLNDFQSGCTNLSDFIHPPLEVMFLSFWEQLEPLKKSSVESAWLEIIDSIKSGLNMDT